MCVCVFPASNFHVSLIVSPHLSRTLFQVGPYSNPTETYPYYSLPFCRPDSMKRQSQQLGELLSGDRKVNTPYHVKFREDVHNAELCDRTLSYGDVLAFTRACEEDYFFELYVDGLPVWGYIGEHEHEDLILGHTENSKHYLCVPARFFFFLRCPPSPLT